jgi:hypothetical protein
MQTRTWNIEDITQRIFITCRRAIYRQLQTRITNQHKELNDALIAAVKQEISEQWAEATVDALPQNNSNNNKKRKVVDDAEIQEIERRVQNFIADNLASSSTNVTPCDFQELYIDPFVSGMLS